MPDGVRKHVVDVFVDTIAGMAAGSDRGPHVALRNLLVRGVGEGMATVIGSDRGASTADAVFLNATLPTVYQLDEGHRISRGHPGIHIVPVILAVAEQLGASVDDALSALVAGYEVASRIGVAMNGTRPEIHPHGNWGAVGAAVAAAHLLSKGDAATIASAIDIASGVAGFPDRRAASAGAGVHHLWASIGAHTGFVAGASAFAGLTPVVGTLEDYLLPQSGLAPDAAALTASIDPVSERWITFMIGANYTKFWAACGHTHTAIGAALKILSRERVDPNEIESIEVNTFQAASSLDNRAPLNELAARYSIPAVVASTILDRSFDLDALREQRISSQDWRSLANRVKVIHDPARDSEYPRLGRPLRMTILLSDGRVLEYDSALSYGDAERPASREAIHEKALSLFARRFGDVAGRRVLEAAVGIEQSGSFASLTAALRDAAQEGEGGGVA